MSLRIDRSRQKKLSKPFRVRQHAIAGVPVHCLTIEQASTQIIDVLRRHSAGTPFLIMGPNAQLITVAQRDYRLLEALHASALNVPDGNSVVLASRILGGNIVARVPGGELMEHLCRDSARCGLRVFFLGGLPEAAKLASQQIQRLYPALQVAGAYCPPRGFEHDQMECAHIRQLLTEAAPDLLFVALGVPKQEIWMHQNCSTLPIGAAMSVGAAFDTQSGLRQRAPRWTQSLGLEWLYRLMCEPRRLWRRYLIGNPHFFYLVLRQRFLYGRSAARENALPFPSPKPRSEPESYSSETACNQIRTES